MPSSCPASSGFFQIARSQPLTRPRCFASRPPLSRKGRGEEKFVTDEPDCSAYTQRDRAASGRRARRRWRARRRGPCGRRHIRTSRPEHCWRGRMRRRRRARPSCRRGANRPRAPEEMTFGPAVDHRHQTLLKLKRVAARLQSGHSSRHKVLFCNHVWSLKTEIKLMNKATSFELAQIGTGEDFELLCSELLKSVGLTITRSPSRGPDRGVDMIATSSNTDDLGFTIDVRIAVECKHFSASGRSVTEAAVGNIIERTLSHNCNRYLLITSTIPSSSLAHQIEGINNNPSIPLRANVWNKADVLRLLEKNPHIVDRFLSRKITARSGQKMKTGSESRDEPRIIVVHLHPDFQDELLELINTWNDAQITLKFTPLRPPRELESKLLLNRPLLDMRAVEIACALRSQSGFELQDGIIQFCEGRLHGDKTYQLFASTSLSAGRLAESTISLRMMRILVDDGDIPHAPMFALVIRQLLSVLGHDCGLKSHDSTRGCAMDYCNEMPDIKIGLIGGPKFCPHCERFLAKEKPHLIELATAARRLLSKGKDKQIDKRMKLRDERDSVESTETFDVALSFAGEDRAKANALATALKNNGLRVFYDDFEKSKLWGEDLYSYLSDLYRFRATYCVMFLSQYYARKLWTNHEREAAQERAFRDNRTYILPIRIDDTEIPGILATVGYLRWEDEGPESIVQLIISKLANARKP